MSHPRREYAFSESLSNAAQLKDTEFVEKRQRENILAAFFFQ
ncbi:hypothetical protein CAT7_01422 [Carnobacterium sp. AT7]|nr:hypothetical protein CAT7_01422 [Carnobacterium sp. AT7]